MKNGYTTLTVYEKEDYKLKKVYKRKAWLVDDGILLEGYVAKRKFYLNSFSCGFSFQRIKKKDIGKILFYDKQEAINKTGIPASNIA